jgi:hypothetical protein
LIFRPFNCPIAGNDPAGTDPSELSPTQSKTTCTNLPVEPIANGPVAVTVPAIDLCSYS